MLRSSKTGAYDVKYLWYHRGMPIPLPELISKRTPLFAISELVLACGNIGVSGGDKEIIYTQVPDEEIKLYLNVS